MRQAGEPSVEEILDSIKKVIARDNRANAAATRRERTERGIPRREPEAGPATLPTTMAESDDDVFELDSAAMLDSEPARTASDEPLVTDETRESMRESLAALAMLAEPPAAPQIVRSGETSLEGLVRELLRPALAQWLEAHLPALVERMVADEIARIVGKKRAD